MFPLTCKSTSDRRIRATRGDRFRSSDARERLAREDRAIDIAENPERGTVKKAIGEGTAACCMKFLSRNWVTVRNPMYPCSLVYQGTEPEHSPQIAETEHSGSSSQRPARLLPSWPFWLTPRACEPQRPFRGTKRQLPRHQTETNSRRTCTIGNFREAASLTRTLCERSGKRQTKTRPRRQEAEEALPSPISAHGDQPWHTETESY